jgi:hypothetical protein
MKDSSSEDTRPFGYVSVVLDVTSGLVYASHEAALQMGSYPVNLLMVSGPLHALKRVVGGLKALELDLNPLEPKWLGPEKKS